MGSLARAGNPRAAWSLVFGLVAMLSVPAALVLQYYSATITLVQSTASAGLAILFGLYAVLLARRARERSAQTLGRAGGLRTAWWGRFLGLTGVCIGITTALAVGFYGLLTLFAKS